MFYLSCKIINSSLDDVGKLYFADTSKRDTYAALSYINFNGDGSNDLGAIEFKQGGTILIREPMTAIIMVRVSGSSKTDRAWIILRDYNNKNAIAESIEYGTFFTCQLTTTLDIKSNTVLAVETREELCINDGGFISSIEFIRIK